MNDYSVNRYFNIIDYKILEGWKYNWNAYGINAWCLTNVSDGTWATKYEVLATFDTKTLLIYEVTTYDYENEVSYRWIHPDYVEEVNQEANERNVDNSIAYNDIKFIDINSFEEWETKTREIISKYERSSN